MDDAEIEFEQIDNESGNPEQQQWAHEILTDFETLIDAIGIESVMFLISKEHEDILTSWIKKGVDIQHRRKQ
jgi:hypothetical protein